MSKHNPFELENIPADSNSRTLETYEKLYQEYAERTEGDIPEHVQIWLERALAWLSTNARILEIGSGTGRDASYMADRGYKVQCSDATDGFLEMIQARGLSTRKLNILTDGIEETQDLVLANAVLLHVDREQFKVAVQKVHDALDYSGRFAFTLVKGEGERWTDHKLGEPRYFCYWHEDTVGDILLDAGFSEYEYFEDETGWLSFVATKDPEDSCGLS